VNPLLQKLQPYPFERLRSLLAGSVPPAGLAPIDLSIGEPKHPTPEVLTRALAASLDSLSSYPKTAGSDELRAAIAAWLSARFGLPAVDPASQVLPVCGSREALFSFAQACLDPAGAASVVIPTPGYQIYEGAALLAGARPLFVPVTPQSGFRMPLDRIATHDWERVRLVYTCSPGNPTGYVMSLDEWRELFELSDRHGFIIASDECYSEIYPNEGSPPLGGLQAAARLGRKGFARLVVFGSLSKRSNAPGLRSGFVAGDAALLAGYLKYRTYHGSAMSPAVQAASIAAWRDESHVVENRRLYAEKFTAVTSPIATVLPTQAPDAGFYLWARTPDDDTAYARRLYEKAGVIVLPGSFLARPVDGANPGAGFVRIALVAAAAQVCEAARRIVEYR
jgi:N-succinyldiaminopimelate aminotransferase